MLSADQDLFQEQSIYEASPKDSQEFLNKTSNQFMSNSSFYSQQSTVFQSTNDVEIRPKRIINKNSKAISSLNFYSSPQEFAKSNKTVIFSRKSLEKSPYINCNQSFSNFSNILSNSITIESEDINSDTADENCKKSSLNNTGLQDDNEECGYENQLEKKFISPRTLTKYNVHDISNEQNQRFSSISPTKYSNHSNLLKTLCNPKIKNRRLIVSSLNKSLLEKNNMNINLKIFTQPVVQMSNYSLEVNNLSFEQSNKVLTKKPKIRSRSVYVNNLTNDVVQTQLIQNQNQNQNDKTNLNKLYNLHTTSCFDQKQTNSKLFKRQIEFLHDKSNLLKMKTEYRGFSPKNSTFNSVNPRMNSPLKRRPLFQAVKVQNKQQYETEAKNLIQYYGNSTNSQPLNPTVITQLRSGSTIRPTKQFTESLNSLSNQITQVEKQMLSSYYKEFVKITSD